MLYLLNKLIRELAE